jgi:PTS system mannose-specific IIC component
MLVKALLVAIWAGLCSLDDGGIQLQIRKPLLAGTEYNGWASPSNTVK